HVRARRRTSLADARARPRVCDVRAPDAHRTAGGALRRCPHAARRHGLRVRIVTVCGARPNVMKVAALVHAFREEPRIDSYVVHTGQHYDPRLSSDLCAELGLPPPDVHLHAAPDTPERQLTAIADRFDEVITD